LTRPYNRDTIQAHLGHSLRRKVPQSTKYAIVGSRDWPENQSETVIAYIKSLPMKSVVVSGGARGVDTLAEEQALQSGLAVQIYKADWDKYGKSAGMRRNKDIVDNADALVAFWCNQSKGTANSISRALKRGIPVTVLMDNGLQFNPTKQSDLKEISSQATVLPQKQIQLKL